MTRENNELRTAMQQNSMVVNSETETEPVLDVRSVPQRPVSMYEARDTLRSQVIHKCSMYKKNVKCGKCIMANWQFFLLLLKSFFVITEYYGVTYVFLTCYYIV